MCAWSRTSSDLSAPKSAAAVVDEILGSLAVEDGEGNQARSSG